MRKANNSKPPAPGSSPCASSAPAEVVTVLHIDDDPNDTALLSAAVSRAGVGFRLNNVEDGERAMAYLTGEGKYADRHAHPLPDLILLDLKMPRADGFEVLRWIRQSPRFRHTQVLVLSGSELQEDIRQAYAVGANSYFVKPIGFDALVNLMRNINAFWLNRAQARVSAAASAADAGLGGAELTA